MSQPELPVFELRRATPADAVALARLRFAFRAGEAPPVETEDSFVARCAPWMAERLGPGSAWRAWITVLLASKETVGCLWLQLIEKIPNPAPERERHGYITSVYVSPQVRGRGAGRDMVAAAMAHCEAEQVDSVILWPSERSRSLYASFGFVEGPRDVMQAVLHDGRAAAKRPEGGR